MSQVPPWKQSEEALEVAREIISKVHGIFMSHSAGEVTVPELEEAIEKIDAALKRIRSVDRTIKRKQENGG